VVGGGGGAAVALLGQLIASPLLSILNVPEDVFPYALLYEPTDGNNPSKPHKIGPFFLM